MNHTLKILVHKMVTKKEEVTHDEQYERSEQRFIQHFNASLQLLSSLDAYVIALNKMGMMSKDFGDVLSSYYQTGDVTQPRGIEAFNTAVSAVEKTTRSLTSKELRDQVLVEWSEYCGFLQTLFNKVAERKQLLQDFDYYKKKVRDLKEKPSRDETSLPRNESKLHTAETAYDTINQELIDVFNSVSIDAHSAFNNLLQKVLASTATIHSENGRVTANLHDIVASPESFGVDLKDPKYKPLKVHYGISPVDPAKLKHILPPRDPHNIPGSTTAAATSASSFSSASFGQSGGAVPATTTAIVVNTDDNNSSGRKRVRGVFDFEASNDDELSFRVGDILLVVDESEEGWWMVEKDGKKGMIPFNYVEVL
eukprot:c20311_g1_i1.p1 GENE.c20311_g1_i1~~c20311_g1_i1.p1  ORF type:complete len:387 (+),score=127.59 c20311_g1_i1:62-1162(+)